MSRYKAREVVVAYGMALVYLFLIMLPVSLSIYHRHNLIRNGEPIEIEGGLMFVYPQICWILTTPGIIISVICLSVMVLISWIFSRKIDNFPFRFWICLSFFGWASFLTAFGLSFYENRHNHVFIGDKEMSISKQGQTVEFNLSGIRGIERKGNVYIIRFEGKKSYRLRQKDISMLLGRDELIDKIDEWAETIEQTNGRSVQLSNPTAN